MKKLLLVAVLCSFSFAGYNAHAEEGAGAATETTASPVAQALPAATAETTEVTEPAEPQAPAETTPPNAEIANAENLEFISGEVTGLDEVAGALTVKLYGETEADTNPKSLVVHVDETTDITDGEKDRDVKSLATGTEVDVEYDPASNKATYIFVY